MNEPMQIQHLKAGMVVRREIDGEVLDLFVCDIDKSDNQISGTVIKRPGRFGERHTFWVRETEPLEVYSYQGTRQGARLYPGITKAEVLANQVYEQALAAGLKVSIEVEFKGSYTSATVRLAGSTMYDDTIAACWMTSTQGRRTTRYGYGYEMRGVLSKRKSMVKLTQKKFFEQLGWACWMHEHKAAGV
jgi:hypothetical protein